MTKKPDYAGFWIRLIAALIDIAVTTPILAIVFYLAGFDDIQTFKITEGNYNYTMESFSSYESNASDLIFWIILACYSVFLISSKRQATIGKRICRIYVGTEDGKRLSKLRALGRFLSSAFLIPLTFGIGVIMIAFTKEKTALHDLICKTRVFYGKPEDQ